jgi:hypothetical protein
LRSPRSAKKIRGWQPSVVLLLTFRHAALESRTSVVSCRIAGDGWNDIAERDHMASPDRVRLEMLSPLRVCTTAMSGGHVVRRTVRDRRRQRDKKVSQTASHAVDGHAKLTHLG